MLTIYHLNRSRSERVIWLAEELGIPYDLQRFERTPAGGAPETLKQFSPLGKAPAIRDGETVIVESGAILEYIAQRYGNGRFTLQPSAPDYGRYLQWLHFAEGSAMSQYLLPFYLDRAQVDPQLPLRLILEERSRAMTEYIEQELGKAAYFAGDDFTVADMMMGFVLTGWLRGYQKLDFTSYPNIDAYLQRIEARPAYQKAMALAA